MIRHKPNIILITADSLRADRLGCYGYGRGTSPNIDRLAAESALYNQAFSVGPNTPHAFPGIMTSQHALSFRRLGLFDQDVTLAECLQSMGYLTIGLNAANPYLSRRFRYDRGFTEFQDYLEDESVFETPSPTREADNRSNGPSRATGHSPIDIPKLDLRHYIISEENSRSKAALENRISTDVLEAIAQASSGPFFLWVHYMDTHYPYLPQKQPQLDLGMTPISKEENLELNRIVRENLDCSPGSLLKLRSLYDAAVRQLDDKIGLVISALRNADLFDSSLIILTADHGEEFREHGDFQHNSKLFDELLRVPLIVKRPSMGKPELHDELVSLVQLAPTVLGEVSDESSFETPSFLDNRYESEDALKRNMILAGASYGKNGHAPVDHALLNVDPLPKVFCLRTRQWKVIWDTDRSGNLLFNLITDPGEMQNAAREYPQQNRRLTEVLKKHSGQLERGRLRKQILSARRKLHNYLPDAAVRSSI